MENRSTISDDGNRIMSKHQPLDHNRVIVNQQHYEDTRDISPLEENNDTIDQTNDTPTRTINESENTDKPPSPASKTMGAEDPFWTEGWQNKGWLCTGSLFLVTFSVFGILFCWGVFQPYYLDHVYPGQTDVFQIAFIGTSAQCLTTLLGLPLSWVIRCIGYKGTMAIGMLLFPSSLILASFATQLWHVLMTQGILLGIGAAFCFSASFMLPSQWFVRHRSLANGIGNTGSCVGALCLSPLAQHLIETLGYRNALRVLGAIVFALLSLATILARARYPPSSSTPTIMQKSSNTISVRSSPLFSTPFALGLIFSLLVPFGYVVPFYLMPTYAMQQVGASASMGAALVSIGMATGVVSRLGSGFIGDRIGPINTLSILTLISAILIMVLWTFSHTLPLYGVYCAAIGLTAGTYFGLVPAVLARIAGMQYLYVSGAVAWMFISIGSLLGTPCVGKLQKDIGWLYAILFTGIAELIAALCMLAIRFTLDRRLCSKL